MSEAIDKAQQNAHDALGSFKVEVEPHELESAASAGKLKFA